MNANATDASQLSSILTAQREAFLKDGVPSPQARRSDLLKLKNAILSRKQDYETAINADFGNRSAHETAILELMPTVQGIDYMRSNLRRWMRPRSRHVAIQFLPGAAKVVMQPLGVVGVVAPWNYPAGLCLMPLATAIAAGNRVMVKPSEYTPRTSELMASMLADIFPKEQVAVILGDAEIGAAFSSLPFDHLVFTGSTTVGRAVMRAASENLVPVTLELGGKSPVIIDRGFSPIRAAKLITFGKLSNAGQTCIAPDYALIHESEVDAFVETFDAAVRSAYPGGTSDKDYGSIISQRHYDRLVGLVEDAKQKGAKVREVGVTSAPPRTRTYPPTIIMGATPQMTVMQQEIFGPLLPIVSYRQLSDAISFVNAKPRPLALYMFSDRRANVAEVLERTTSGNVTINDTLLHYAQDDLPFGGVGPSGMGAYHGEEGFKSLSHAKGIFTQARWNFISAIRAPFGRLTDIVLNLLLR